jgi:transposase
MVARRTSALVRVQVDDDLVVLGVLADRRDELGRARTQLLNRLHRILLDLLPGGANRSPSSRQARPLLASVRPGDLVGNTRRRIAVELTGQLEAIDKKIRTVERDLQALVIARGSTLMDLNGIGPSGAARLLADAGDLHRFADRAKFASWTGTAPPGRLPRRPPTPPPIQIRQPAGSTGSCTPWPSSGCATQSLRDGHTTTAAQPAECRP